MAPFNNTGFVDHEVFRCKFTAKVGVFLLEFHGNSGAVSSQRADGCKPTNAVNKDRMEGRRGLRCLVKGVGVPHKLQVFFGSGFGFDVG